MTDDEYDEVPIYWDDEGDPYTHDEQGRLVMLEQLLDDDGEPYYEVALSADEIETVTRALGEQDGREVNNAWARDTFEREIDRYAREIGRISEGFGGQSVATQLTAREHKAIAESVAYQLGRGERIDMEAAWREAKAYDPRSDDREAFRTWQHERLRDVQEADQEPNEKREYSNNDPEERREWQIRKLAGDDVVLIGGRSDLEAKAKEAADTEAEE